MVFGSSRKGYLGLFQLDPNAESLAQIQINILHRKSGLQRQNECHIWLPSSDRKSTSSAAVQQLSKVWQGSIFSSHTEFEKTFGQKAKQKRKLFNCVLRPWVVKVNDQHQPLTDDQ